MGLRADDFFFLRRQRDAQCLRDTARNFFLDGENILQLPVVALGPDGMPSGGFDKLRRNPHAVSRAADGAFEDVGGAELLAHLLRRDRLVAKREHLRARENFQLRDFRKLGDDVFRNPIAEVFVFFRATLIFEIENRDRFLLGRRRVGCRSRIALLFRPPPAGGSIPCRASGASGPRGVQRRSGSASRRLSRAPSREYFRTQRAAAHFALWPAPGAECRIPSKINAEVVPEKGTAPVAIS